MKDNGSHWSRHLPHGAVTAAFILFVIVFGIRSHLMLGCADTGWHIAAGKLIRTQGSIPLTDPWAFTTTGVQWFNLSWAWDVWASWLYDLGGGFYLNVLSTVLINALTLAILIAVGLSRGASPPALFIALALGSIPYSYGIAVRSFQATYLFAAVAVLLLERSKGFAQEWLLFFVPLLALLWANMHGGFLALFPLLASVMLDAALERQWSWFARLLLISLLSALAILVTPWGLDVFYATFLLLNSPLHSIISEWQPLSVSKRFTFYYPYIILFVVAAPLAFRTAKRQPGAILLGIAWLILVLREQRHLPLFVVFSLAPAALGIDRLVRYSSQLQRFWERKAQQYARDFCRPTVRAFLFGTAIILVVALTVARGTGLLRAEVREDVNGTSYPLAEISQLAETYPHTRWLNFYFWGGYMIAFGHDKMPVFIDGRAENVFVGRIPEDYLKFYFLRDGWEEIVSRYGIEGAFVPSGSIWDDYFSRHDEWKRILHTPIAAAYLYRATKHSAQLADGQVTTALQSMRGTDVQESPLDASAP